MSDYIRIGEALVAREVITKDQLAEMLTDGIENDEVPFGQRLVDRFDISQTIVDEVNVHEVLMPRFRRQLLTQLLTISKDDKFAKGMDVKSFVVGIVTRPEKVEVRMIWRRMYNVDADGFQFSSNDRGFVTNMDVRVTLKTRSGQSVNGRIQVRHDSLERKMSILDDEKHIRESVYYGLRTAYRAEN